MNKKDSQKCLIVVKITHQPVNHNVKTLQPDCEHITQDSHNQQK